MPERALFPGVDDSAAGGGRVGSAARRDARGVRACALLVAFEMSRGFNSAFYPYLYEWLPFIRGLRVPARASILVGLTLALLAAFGVRRLLAGRRRGCSAARWRRSWSRSRSTCGRCCGSNPSGSSRRRSTASSAGEPSVVLAEFPFGGNPTPIHAERAVHVLFALALGADDQRLQRPLPAGSGRLRGRVEGFPGRARDRSAARARRDARHRSTARSTADGCDELVAAVDALPAFRVVASGKMAGRAGAAVRADRR